MADPVEIRDGDLVLVNRAGLYVAWVQRASARDLVIEPCDRSTPDGRVSIDEVQAVYRFAGSPARSDGRLRLARDSCVFDDVDPPTTAS